MSTKQLKVSSFTGFIATLMERDEVTKLFILYSIEMMANQIANTPLEKVIVGGTMTPEAWKAAAENLSFEIEKRYAETKNNVH